MISYTQTYFPLEYRTPPLPLVALIGCSESHREIAEFFVHQLRPPLVSLYTTAEATDAFLARNFGPGKQRTPATAPGAPTGIIKGDWLAKHRGRRPAVALVIVSRNDLEGDPSAWSRMLQLLRSVREAAVVRGGAAMVVAVVQGPEAGDLPPERVTGVCHNLSLDPRLLVPLVVHLPPGALADDVMRAVREASLRQLGALVHEQCAGVYARHAAGVSARLTERQQAAAAAADNDQQPFGQQLRRGTPLELSIRAAFKLASYAEFRQDWKQAVVDYQAAYALLKQAVLALLGPLDGPPAAAAAALGRASQDRRAAAPQAAHAAHASEQAGRGSSAGTAAPHAVRGAYVATPRRCRRLHRSRCSRPQRTARTCRSWSDSTRLLPRSCCPKTEAALAAGQSLGQAAREMSRASLLLAAAELAVQRRKACDEIRAQRQLRGGGAPAAVDASLVRRGVFLGQLVLRFGSGSGSGAGRPLTDAEYVAYLEGEEAGPAALSSSAATSAAQPQGVAAAGALGASASAPRTLPDPVAASLEVLNTALLALQQPLPGGGASGGRRQAAGAGASERLRCRLTLMLAGEHFAASNFSAARKLLLQACHAYRKEGWVAPLRRRWRCCGRPPRSCGCFRSRPSTPSSSWPSEAAWQAAWEQPSHARASCHLFARVQMALAGPPRPPLPPPPPCRPPRALCLPRGTAPPHHAPASPSGAKPAHHHVPREYTYLVEYTDGPAGGGGGGVTRQQQQQTSTAGREEGGEGMHEPSHRRRQQDFGWWRCIAVASGSQPCVSGSSPFTSPSARSSVAPGSERLDLHIAFWNLLPAVVELAGAYLTLEDAQGQWEVALRGHQHQHQHQHSHAPGEQRQGQGALGSGEEQERLAEVSVVVPGARSHHLGLGGGRFEAPPGVEPMSLRPGRWERTRVRVEPRCAGRLRIERVVLLLSEHAAVAFHASTFPAHPPHASLGNLATQLGLPTPLPGHAVSLHGPRVVPAAWHLVLPHLGPLPTVRIEAPPMLLVGEQAPVSVRVLNSGRALSGGIVEFAVKLGPGLAAGDLTLTVENEGRLCSLPLDGQGRVSLPLLPAGGGTHCVRAWMRADRAGKVTLTTVLLCPAPVTAVADLAFDEPFEYRCQLASEAGVHTLTPPRLSSPEAGVTPVTIGQQIVLHVHLRGLQRHTNLELCSAKLLPNRDAGLSPLAELSSQLAGWPAALGCGDTHTLLLPMCPTRTTDGAVALGKLQLVWRRAATPSSAAASAAAGPTGATANGHAEGEGGSGPAAPAPAAAATAAAATAAAVGVVPEPLVTTSLDLPRVSVGDSLLTVRNVGPGTLTAGISFTYSIQIQNFSHHEVDLAVSLQDSAGFVMSGERTQALSVAARDSSSVIWNLVAFAAGNLLLPSVRVLAPRLNSVLATQSCQVYVLPF